MKYEKDFEKWFHVRSGGCVVVVKSSAFKGWAACEDFYENKISKALEMLKELDWNNVEDNVSEIIKVLEN